MALCSCSIVQKLNGLKTTLHRYSDHMRTLTRSVCMFPRAVVFNGFGPVGMRFAALAPNDHEWVILQRNRATPEHRGQFSNSSHKGSNSSLGQRTAATAV